MDASCQLPELVDDAFAVTSYRAVVEHFLSDDLIQHSCIMAGREGFQLIDDGL